MDSKGLKNMDFPTKLWLFLDQQGMCILWLGPIQTRFNQETPRSEGIEKTGWGSREKKKKILNWQLKNMDKFQEIRMRKKEQQGLQPVQPGPEQAEFWKLTPHVCKKDDYPYENRKPLYMQFGHSELK